MAEFDFKDHYIGYLGHPKFIVNKIIEDDVIRVVIQKYEMLLFTNKGELLGDSDFGCDLQKLLFETRIAKSGVKTIIIEQINKYIPEIRNINYVLDVQFSTDPENFQEVMEIFFTISDYEVYFVVS
jgi:phage baseplate assembly protein W